MLEALHPGRIDLGIGRAPGHRPGHRLRAPPWPGRARRRRLPRAAHRAARLLLRLAARRVIPYEHINAVPGTRLPAGDLDARIEHLRRAGGGRARHAVLVRLPLRAGDARRTRSTAYRRAFRPSPELDAPVRDARGVGGVRRDRRARPLARRARHARVPPPALGPARRLPDAGGGGRVPLHAVRAPAGGRSGRRRT